MKFKKIEPPAYLKDYIRYFWTLESSGTDTFPKTFGTIADGCPGFVFQQSEQGTFYDQDNKQLPGIFLYGQTTRHTKIHSTGKFTTIAAYFRPNALKTIFGFDADELTDSCLDLNSMSEQQDFHLLDLLFNAPSKADQIEILSSYLFLQVRRNSAQVDGVAQYALSQIIKSQGHVSLKQLQEQLHLSERSFERKFKQWVGISPKFFSRICRFQASLNQLRNGNFQKLSDIAFENDYADQSHFIRAFREFAGSSPYQYQRQSHEVVENFPELTT